MKDYDFISKIEDMVEKRRKTDPFQQEYNRLLNEVYPIKTLENIYWLGYCYMLATLKKDLYKHFCKDDQLIVDEIIKFTRENKKIDEMLNKLLI